MNSGAKLPHQNAACCHALAAEAFHSAPLSCTVAAISRTAACFFMGHEGSPEKLKRNEKKSQPLVLTA
jgi:hypothetical protein